MQKEKILFVISNMKIGGIQKNTLNSLIELNEKFDITLCVFYDSGAYFDQIPEGIKIITPDAAYRTLGMTNADAVKRFPAIMRRIYYYIIMRLFGNGAMYKAMLKRQKNLGSFDYAVSTMQSAIEGMFCSGCNELILEKVDAKQKIAYVHCDFVLSGIDNEYNRSVYLRMDKVLVPNRSNYDQFVSVMPEIKDKVHIVNNFCNYAEVAKKAEEDTVLYDSAKTNIVTVARISPVKGVDRAIEVCKALKDEGYEFTYHVVGGGGNYEELCDRVKELGLSDTVFLHGFDSNPYKYIKNADLFLLPSRHEAAGLVIDEARCLNVPVLSTKTVAAEETLGMHDCGWVCDNSDEGIYKGLKDLLCNPDKIKQKSEQLAQIECNNNIPTTQFCEMLKK